MRRAARKTPEVGVAMLGQGFMGHTHSRAYRAIASSTWPAPLRPRLASLCGRDQAELDEKMARYRWERAVTEWRVQLEDERVQLFDNVGPNTLHLKPTIAAIHRGKHVICEKPLAPSADEAYQLWREAETAQVLHMCAFNYRFFPAIELARRMIEQGEIGDVHHFRSRFLVPSPAADARPAWRDEDPAARGESSLMWLLTISMQLGFWSARSPRYSAGS
jgi:predicted dehydrogenase